MPKILLNTLIKADKSIVFDLARSIDLHKISTRNSNETAISGKTVGLIDLNESVTWRAKHFGVYHTLTSKITAFKEPDFFVDEMVSGVFKSFKHEHHFKDANGTLMTDVFDYTSPFGLLGKLADQLFLRNYMTKFLIERNRVIKDFAESDQWKTII
ncbi:MAG: SRPBCC family protein [Gelidibacter sp.]|uniref:SRPBCC family protein n=1 Tax=Gelidibacter sp. TaxID=2018083 RepID=UPI003265F1A0